MYLYGCSRAVARRTILWLFQDGGTKYYCQKNSCLEKDSRGAKQDQHDLDILFNAAPDVRKENS